MHGEYYSVFWSDLKASLYRMWEVSAGFEIGIDVVWRVLPGVRVERGWDFEKKLE